MTTGKGAERTKHDFRCPICRSAISQASQLFDLRAPLSTDVPVQLLNQSNNDSEKRLDLARLLDRSVFVLLLLPTSTEARSGQNHDTVKLHRESIFYFPLLCIFIITEGLHF